MIKHYKDPQIKKADAIALAGNAANLARITGLSRAAITDWPEFVHPVWAYRLMQIFPELKNAKRS